MRKNIWIFSEWIAYLRVFCQNVQGFYTTQDLRLSRLWTEG